MFEAIEKYRIVTQLWFEGKIFCQISTKTFGVITKCNQCTQMAETFITFEYNQNITP